MSKTKGPRVNTHTHTHTHTRTHNMDKAQY